MIWAKDLPRIRAENEAWRREQLPRLRAETERRMAERRAVVTMLDDAFEDGDRELIRRKTGF